MLAHNYEDIKDYHMFTRIMTAYKLLRRIIEYTYHASERLPTLRYCRLIRAVQGIARYYPDRRDANPSLRITDSPATGEVP